MAEELKITISGDAKNLIAELKRAGVEVVRFGEDTTQAGQRSKQAGVDIGELITRFGLVQQAQQAAAWLKEFAQESFMAAAQAESLGRATEALAQGIGSNGQAMVEAITSASQGTIGQLAAMEAANKAMMFGLVENSGQMSELTSIAVTLGRAMGQDAAKSIDDLTIALGRQSPLILDNLGITLKLEDAYKIYADQLGKTVESLTEQEKKQAFVNAALSIGRQRIEELGGVQLDSAARVEQMTATWSDFQVSFGQLMLTMNQSFGVTEKVTGLLDQMTQGAVAWGEIITTVTELNIESENGWLGSAAAIQAVNEASYGLLGVLNPVAGVMAAASASYVAHADAVQLVGEANDKLAGSMLASATSIEQVQAAMANGLQDLEQTKLGFVAGTSSIDEYNAQLDKLIDMSIEAGTGFEFALNYLRLSQTEYTALKAATDAETAALIEQNAELARNAETMRLTGLAAYYQQEAVREQENAIRSLSAESQRWAGLAQADIGLLEEMAQGHLTTAEEAKKYAEAQKEAAEAERQRQESLTTLAGQMGEYYLSLAEQQAEAQGREQEFNAAMAGAQAEAATQRTAAEQELTGQLTALEEERQEKIHWVLTGAHARTQQENDEALSYWNQHYDELKTAAETKYTETTTAIENELTRRRSVEQAAQAQEKAEYDAHLNELKLKTVLGMMETSGQLERLTGLVGVNVNEMLTLIQSGIVPVSQEMALAIQSAMGELATNSDQAAATATANQDALQAALAGTVGKAQETGTAFAAMKSPVEAAAAALIGMGAVTSEGGGLEALARQAADLSGQFSAMPEAIDKTGESLMRIAGGGGAAGGEQGGDEKKEGEGGGGGLSGMITQVNDLANSFGTTLPEQITTTQAASTAMAEEVMTGLTTVQTGTERTTMLFENITTSTMPNLALSSATTSEAIVGHMGNIKKAGEMMSNTTANGFKRVVDTAENLISKLEEIVAWLIEVQRRARDAASAMGEVTSHGGNTGVDGARAGGGPVSSGSMYLVGEKGPELFMPNTSGFVAPFSAPLQLSSAEGGGAAAGGSLTIQNLNLFGVQDAWKLFEELRNVARMNGLEFATMR